MTRERIEDMREVVLPFVKKRLLETNYEGLGKSDAEEFTRDFNEILELAIKALEQEQRWIPVSERLPEKNMPCLVAVGKFNITQIAMYSDLMGTIDHRIFYQGDYGNKNFENITEYVKAWKPLPKTYQIESEE